MKRIFPALAFSFFTLILRSQVSMEAALPAAIAPGTELTFEVKIHKGTVANFAKYQIDVPAGVSLSEVENQTGSFSFENGRGKIIWVAIPAESEFVVRLKLNAGTASGTGVFNQKFYFLENGSKKEVEANPITVSFSADAKNTAPGQVTSNAVPSSQPVAAEPAKTEPVPATVPPVEKKPEPVRNVEAVKEPAKTAVEPAKTMEAVKTAPPVAASGEVVYRIQLGAYGEDPGKAKYKGLPDVSIVKEGSFYKVLVGSFKNKEDAVKRRAELQAQGFNGFVVAYQNGARVK